MANVALLATIADLKASQVAQAVSPVMPSGVILPFGGATAPTGWLLCDGTPVSRTTYADLFAAVGVAHGDGSKNADGTNSGFTGTHFNLPDLRGRFMRGVSGTSTNDPDKAGRTAANTGGNSGNLVGSVQTNATKTNGLSIGTITATTSLNHTHTNGSGTIDISHGHGSGTASISGLQHGSRSYGYTPAGSQDRWDDRYNAGGETGGTGSATVADLPSPANKSFTNGGSSLSGTNNAGLSLTSGTISTTDSETRPLNANVNYIIKV
jgi:microcystin-dependent protein